MRWLFQNRVVSPPVTFQEVVVLSRLLAGHAAVNPGRQGPKPLLCVRGHAASASPRRAAKCPVPARAPPGLRGQAAAGLQLCKPWNAASRTGREPHRASLCPVPGAKQGKPRVWEGPVTPPLPQAGCCRSSSWPLSALSSSPLSCPRALSASSLSSNTPVPLHRLRSLPGTQPPHPTPELQNLTSVLPVSTPRSPYQQDLSWPLNTPAPAGTPRVSVPALLSPLP